MGRKNLVKWVVVENMAGYMPDNENGYHTNRVSAEADAKYRADGYRESGDTNDKGKWVPDYTVSGSARNGGYAVERSNDDGYGLPIYISIDRYQDGSRRDTETGQLYDNEGNEVNE